LDADGLAALMASMRPRLHRYCARIVGSAFDGEDIVQDTLVKAAEAFPRAGNLTNPEGWLLRIAHNTAIDALRVRSREGIPESDEVLAGLPDESAATDARVVAAQGLAIFQQLPTLQRSTVVLADVLGHSTAEMAELLGLSAAAVKAALHRGRGRLQSLAAAVESPPPPRSGRDHERLCAYADRFNARDFDALRDMLSEEVRLELVGRTRLAGRAEVSTYFTRYAAQTDWQFSPGWAEGRALLQVSNPAVPGGPPDYVVLIDWADREVARIRDFRHARYVMDCLAVEAWGGSGPGR